MENVIKTDIGWAENGETLVCTVTMPAEAADVATMQAAAVWSMQRRLSILDLYPPGYRLEAVATTQAAFADGQCTVVFAETDARILGALAEQQQETSR